MIFYYKSKLRTAGGSVNQGAGLPDFGTRAATGHILAQALHASATAVAIKVRLPGNRAMAKLSWQLGQSTNVTRITVETLC